MQRNKSVLKNELEPRLEEARAGKRVVYFMDAAHCVHSAFLGFLWCLTRVCRKAPSGPQRFNVVAALEAIKHELLTVTNPSYINAQSVCQLLGLIAKRRVGVPSRSCWTTRATSAVVWCRAMGQHLASSCCFCRRTGRT
jgi:hypothetical protein